MLAISHDYRFDFDEEEARERVCRSAQRAIDLASNLAAANLAFSLCHTKNDDWQRMLESARRAVALAPSFSMAYNMLAAALNRLERDDEARAVREQGLDIDPMNPTLIIKAAFEHHHWGEQKRAEELFLRAANAPEPARTISWHLSVFYGDLMFQSQQALLQGQLTECSITPMPYSKQVQVRRLLICLRESLHKPRASTSKMTSRGP
jgi:hypothetical protein